MDTVTLGRTGLEVGVAGLGCGGASRLGFGSGGDESDAINVVRAAMELGVNLIDTARAYRTEAAVGKAIAGHRDEVVLCSKALIQTGGGDDGAPVRLAEPAALRDSVEKSLERLGTDHIDVFYLHGVQDSAYDHCRDHLVPELQALRDEGKIGHLAISELFGRDTTHVMAQRALADDVFDVMMIGYNLLNPSAARTVFPTTMAQGVGTTAMFVVRKALSDEWLLEQTIKDLVLNGHLESGVLGRENPLGFLLDGADASGPERASSVIEAAYRFARHTAGVDVVLTGTGSVDHLRANVAAINAPALPSGDLERLDELFGHLDHLSGD